MVQVDPKTQQILIVTGVVMVVFILILCVIAPWNRNGARAAQPSVTDDMSDHDTTDPENPIVGEDGPSEQSAEIYTSRAEARDTIQSEQTRHRQALLRSRGNVHRQTVPPTTSAVMLAAMRSPARSRTAAQSADYVDTYDINNLKPAELGRQ